MFTTTGTSKTLSKLLHFFFSNPQTSSYLRELERTLGIPAGSLQRHLGALEKEGLLKTRRQGPLKYFSLNTDYHYFPELQSMILREQRRKELEKNLQKVVALLKKNYQPEKIILFGSLAKGRVSPESDIDLLIVKKELPPRYWDRVKIISPLFKNFDVGVDYVLWTPQEMEEQLKQNLFLREEILQKGKVLYDRAARRVAG